MNRGNSPNNIVNGGYAAIQDGFIYFGNKGKERGIYKADLQFAHIERICKDVAIEVSVLGDWIYYVNNSDGNSIYRLSIDAGQKEKLNNDYSACINVVGDWIYYTKADIDVPYSARIYKMKIDGTNRTKLSDDPCNELVVDGEWIYFIREEQACDAYITPLYKMKLDGTQVTQLYRYDAWSMHVLEDRICFLDFSKGLVLSSIDKEGGNYTVLGSISLKYLNIENGWMYFNSNYQSAHGKERLCKMKTGNTGFAELSEDTPYYINVAGDWLIYVTEDENRKLAMYRVKQDGTMRSLAVIPAQ